MPTSKVWVAALSIKQLIFIGALAVFSVLLSVLVLFCFSRTTTTSDGPPYGFVSPVVYAGSAQA